MLGPTPAPGSPSCAASAAACCDDETRALSIPGAKMSAPLERASAPVAAASAPAPAASTMPEVLTSAAFAPRSAIPPATPAVRPDIRPLLRSPVIAAVATPVSAPVARAPSPRDFMPIPAIIGRKGRNASGWPVTGFVVNSPVGDSDAIPATSTGFM